MLGISKEDWRIETEFRTENIVKAGKLAGECQIVTQLMISESESSHPVVKEESLVTLFKFIQM